MHRSGIDLYYLRMGGKDLDTDEIQRRFFAKVVAGREILGLFDHLEGVHFFAKDAESRFVAANYATLARDGISSEREIVGKTDYDFHPPVMAASYVEEDRRVMASRVVLPKQIWLVYDHLRIQRWYQSTKVPLVGRDGEVLGLAGAMQPLEVIGAGRHAFRELTPAVDFVLANYDGKVRIEALAELVGLSISQFDRTFRKLLGMTPSQYVVRVRINAARSLLSQTEMPVGEVAAECGFYDQSQLARLFKRATGMSPSGYRGRFGKG
ncbi:MAG: AraC family transcriptional regulator [Verrucomicrobiales bacterium]|nr:AraC family transcriptional regulator [Verrucomicrobiales bacterium]